MAIFSQSMKTTLKNVYSKYKCIKSLQNNILKETECSKNNRQRLNGAKHHRMDGALIQYLVCLKDKRDLGSQTHRVDGH